MELNEHNCLTKVLKLYSFTQAATFYFSKYFNKESTHNKDKQNPNHTVLNELTF